MINFDFSGRGASAPLPLSSADAHGCEYKIQNIIFFSHYSKVPIAMQFPNGADSF